MVTTQMHKRLLRVYNFGDVLVPYSKALVLQSRLASLCKRIDEPDSLVLLQHPPVYTLGKRGREEDFLTSRDNLLKRGASIFRSSRGGETTFHGPGQLIVYPIVNLRRLGRGARSFVEGLEDVLVCTLVDLKIAARGRQPRRTGVWVEDRKIAAIGVQISSGITTHGMALNANTDLSFFDHIVPCGIADKEVTSIQKELNREAPIVDLSTQILQAFMREFQYDQFDATLPVVELEEPQE